MTAYSGTTSTPASTDGRARLARTAERALDAVADWHEFQILRSCIGERWSAAITSAAHQLTSTLSEPGQDASDPTAARVLAAYLLRRCLEEELLREAAASAGASLPEQALPVVAEQALPVVTEQALPLVAAATAALYVDVVRDGDTQDLPGISRRVRAVLRDRLDMLAGSDGAGDDAAVVGGLMAAVASPSGRPPGTTAELEAALLRAAPLLPPVELLLHAGGDDRQVLDPGTLEDRYGLGLYPPTTPLTFASCTASAPTTEGFGLAARCRAALVIAALDGELEERIIADWAAVRDQLLDVLGVDADLGVEVVPTPSGTDAELVPLALCLARGRPVATIVLAPGEVGSGTTGAASGTAFAERRPNGGRGPVGEPHVAGDRAPLLHRIEVRDEHGAARTPAELEGELQGVIERSLEDGHQVLLHVVEGSKTEVRAPSSRAVLAWKQRYGDRLDVVVDAAQARVTPGELHAYLEVGASVIVTGSKFYGGPPFSGAVLLPASLLADGGAAAIAGEPAAAIAGEPAAAIAGEPAAAIAGDPAAAGGPGGVELSDYLDLRALPPGIRPPGTTPAAPPNLGLLLRWRTALHELHSYAALDDGVRARIVHELSSVVRRQIDAHPSLEAVATSSSEVAAGHQPAGALPATIFSFRVRAGGAFLGLDALRSLHARLRAPMTTAAELRRPDGHVLPVGVELGQPVPLGANGEGGAVLRLAIGAHNITRTALDPGRGSGLDRRIQREANDIRLALDRVERLARRATPT